MRVFYYVLVWVLEAYGKLMWEKIIRLRVEIGGVKEAGRK